MAIQSVNLGRCEAQLLIHLNDGTMISMEGACANLQFSSDTADTINDVMVGAVDRVEIDESLEAHITGGRGLRIWQQGTDAQEAPTVDRIMESQGFVSMGEIPIERLRDIDI